MNFRRLISAASVVLASLLMMVQTLQSLVLITSAAKETKQAEKARKPNRRLPPKS
jgi:hypothetical protein